MKIMDRPCKIFLIFAQKAARTAVWVATPNYFYAYQIF